MSHRIRHCVECPKCLTRYLVGYSPYRNGSYLVSGAGNFEVYKLYCSCGRSAFSLRWSELKRYVVSKPAHDRGYGPPEEIVDASHCEKRLS
jgi:hypothetical protein